MTGLYEVEIEPEVRSWLAGLSDRDFGRVDFLVGLLAEQADDLGEPYTRHLLMTVFRKTRGTETAEVARALRAQMICETQIRPVSPTLDSADVRAILNSIQ
jgi:hypothetical protein